MGYTHEARFKKKFRLEKNWQMNVDDVVEVTGLEPEDLKAVFFKHLELTRSRTKAMNEVFGYCLKTLFPKEKPDEEINGRSDTS